MIPEQQALDRLTRQDELLAQMIPILEQIKDQGVSSSYAAPPPAPSGDLAELLSLQQQQHNIDFNVFTLTYPRDGTRLIIAAGTTVFDFLAGTVAAPGVAVVDMGNSLGLQRKEFMRALHLNADTDIVVRVGSGDRMPVRAGVHPTFPFRQFTTVEVTCTEDTEILISASTSSAAIIQMGGEVSPSTHEFTGAVYENEHVMTGLEAWDVSTAVYLQNFSVAAQEAFPQGIFFNPTGTKMYIIGNVGADVNEYDLSTGWDVSTAVYLLNFSVVAQEAYPQGIFLNPDGTKMYIVGTDGDDVNEYDLSPYRFETTKLLLRDLIIRISSADAEIGDANHQRYPKSAGSSLGFTKADLSKLYFKNATLGSNTKINILGTRL